MYIRDIGWDQLKHLISETRLKLYKLGPRVELTSIGWLVCRASSSRARPKSWYTNCVQILNSGKQWSTQRYSIQDANPSFSHRFVHHSWRSEKSCFIITYNVIASQTDLLLYCVHMSEVFLSRNVSNMWTPLLIYLHLCISLKLQKRKPLERT